MSARLGDRVQELLRAFQMMAAASLLFLIAVVLAGTVPAIFGYESFVVYSGSMEPALGVGDLAVVAPVSPDQLSVGDIITYRPVQNPTTVVTHRLADVRTDEAGRYAFQTKGDANPVVDQVAVEPGVIVGRVAYWIPKVGYLVDFAKRPEGRILLIGIPGVLLGLDYLLGLRKKKERPAPASAARGLVAQGRIALAKGAPHTALALLDEAISADPRLDEAWLLKAQCLPVGPERLTCLQAGLAVNSGSKSLQRALQNERGAAVAP